MTSDLNEFLEMVQFGFFVGFSVFLRIGSAIAVLPAFGSTSIPQRVRLALAIGFSVVIAPSVFPNFDTAPDLEKSFVAIIFTELIVGFSVGLVFRMFIFVLQIAGTIAAQSTSLSQILGTAGLEPLPAIGHILVVGGLALAAMNNLHLTVVEVFIKSYSVFPAGSFPDPTVLAGWGKNQVANAFSIAFTLASPFLIASFLYNFTLGIINKAMPQLMVAFVGAPAITAGGLMLLFLCVPLLLSIWHSEFLYFLTNPFVVIR